MAGEEPSRRESLARRASQAATDAARLARLTRDLPRFLRHPVPPALAERRIQRRLATREARFLTLVERAIYGYQRSPYLRLLQHAGCQPGDLRALVDREGIEEALGVLASQGVYLTFDEQRGHRAVVRGSLRFSFHITDLDNPTVPQHYSIYTSGSSGIPIGIPRTLAQIGEVAETISVVFETHGLHNPRHVVWLTGPVDKLLSQARLGQESAAWFYPLRPLPVEVNVGGAYLRAVSRLGGYRLSSPTFLDLHQPERLVTWLRREAAPGRPILVSTTASSAVRVAVAAGETGVRLDDVAFHAQGEPVTEARRRSIEAVGAKVIVNYGSVEINSIGYGCTCPSAVDDVHVFDDRWAVVTRKRAVSDSGPDVDSLLFSALSPFVPWVSFNTELGDYARLERRDCQCRMGQLGLRTHLSGIRSFEKLTGEGMTVIRTNIVPLLDEVLPARFGGSSMDYQLVEQEQPDGATRLVLRVSPSVGAIDEEQVRAAFLDGMLRDSPLDSFMRAMWQHAGTVTVRREAPVAGPGGKILPIHLLKGTAAQAP